MAMTVPKFATETEEADWWYENRDLVTHEFLLAFEEGRVGRGTLMRRAREAEAKKRAESTIELDAEDIVKAREVAERRGMPYETFVKMLVHQALERESSLSN